MPINIPASAKVDVGARATIASLDPYTIVWQQKFDSTVPANVVTFVNKGTAGSGAGGTRRINAFNVVSSDVRIALDRATADVLYITNDAPLRTDLPMNIAASFNSANAATTLVKFYSGIVGTPLKASTFGTTTDGSGAFGTDSAEPLTFGTAGANATGVFYWGALFKVELSFSELNEFILAPNEKYRGCVGFWRFGESGQVLVPDKTGNGNHGTVTVGTPSANTLPFQFPVADDLMSALLVGGTV